MVSVLAGSPSPLRSDAWAVVGAAWGDVVTATQLGCGQVSSHNEVRGACEVSLMGCEVRTAQCCPRLGGSTAVGMTGPGRLGGDLRQEPSATFTPVT